MTGCSEELAEGVLRGERRAIARAITCIENGEAPRVPLLKRLFLNSRRTLVIGVTGSAGAGKSTLVEKLAAAYRGHGFRLGILAVDPTSPFSGGAILGDRIRMQRLANDDGVYIRSMATRGLLGGLSPGVWDAVIVLEAAGCDRVIVETVGAGQEDVEIARLADVTVVVLVPGMGDGVQTFKAGIMELADLIVINKADRGDAGRAEHEILAMLDTASNGSRPDVVKTVATTGEGVDDLVRGIERCEASAAREAPSRERERWRRRISEMIRQRLTERAGERAATHALVDSRLDDIVARQTDPYTVVEELVSGLLIE